MIVGNSRGIAGYWWLRLAEFGQDSGWTMEEFEEALHLGKGVEVVTVMGGGW